jgi:membrane-bound lytic murein transglycosylase B
MKLIALFSLCLSLYSADSIEFNKWKKKLINRAMEQGFSKKFSTKVLDNTFLDNEILEKQQNQTLFDETRDFNAF